MISEGNYENGEKTGYWITYENEITHTEGKYDKGEPVGLWKYYKDNGELESTFDFE
ncbi:MAG: antitoxin component YwqK of YwqJK toxin-antitoxin module [Glaciecola sp.]